MVEIINILTKTNVEDVINERQVGEIRKFIIQPVPKSKRDKIIYIIKRIKEELDNFQIIFECKIKFGFRDKRIEITLYNGKYLFICSLSNLKKIDKDAIGMDIILTHLKKNYGNNNLQIEGIIFYEGNIDIAVFTSITKLLSNDITFIPYGYKTLKEYGVFNK